jgi:Uma2 family endonuclease
MYAPAMSALRQPQSLLTVEEYLERERVAPFRREFVNGTVVAMADGTANHQRIAGNIYAVLRAQLRSRPCEAFTSDLKVRLDKANAFRYPDVSGLCGPILYHDKTRDAYCNPAMIVEVLSATTEAYDRGEKFMLYRLLDSLFEYLLVRQDRMETEVWTRGGDNRWTSVIYNEPSDIITLKTLSCTLTLADIYEKVEFGDV